MIHKLTSATSADAAITFIAPEDTEIVAVKWVLLATGAGADYSIRSELSFAAANQLTLNDVVNVVDEIGAQSDLTTSGAADLALNHFHEIPGGVSIQAGEKLYVHNLFSGVGTFRLTLFLYTSARKTNKSSFRRR